ncbi:MAG: T9SS type A sorting domain-containing protein [Bacteroidales bacterium]|nr:T9SS type A sorting domain-containing protein [Bacteroidales bacterium]
MSFRWLALMFCVFLLVSNNQLQAQNLPDSLAAEKQLSQRGEVYFSFPAKIITENPIEFDALSRYISIDSKDDQYVYAYANLYTFHRFLELGLSYHVLTPPSLQCDTTRWKTILKSISDWNYYPSYSEYITLMQQFAGKYPQLCTLDTIGTSVDGRLLLFAHIRSRKSLPDDRPSFMYTSTMHGDETVGYVLMLHLIDYLLQNYGTNTQVTNLVDSLDIWINPLANPDGTYAGGDASVAGATRFNANGVDLNRNYPDPVAGDHPDGNNWQPETKAFMDFASSHDFVVSANLHSGTEVVNYPWDTWQKRTADDAWWQYVSREYADTVHTYSPSGYFTDLNDGITDGYDWYWITGGRQDYMNYFHHDREFTLELSMVKKPDPSQLPSFWDYNYRSLLNYMKQALYGIRGKVTDSLTGTPLPAEVFISGHDTDNSEVYSDSVSGYYYRPIKSGTYDVTFSASGYVSKTYYGLTISDGKILKQNVKLAENANGISTNKRVRIHIYPNPTLSIIKIQGFTKVALVSVYNLNGIKIIEKSITPDELIDVSTLKPGIYLVRVYTTTISMTKKLVIR